MKNAAERAIERAFIRNHGELMTLLRAGHGFATAAALDARDRNDRGGARQDRLYAARFYKMTKTLEKTMKIAGFVIGAAQDQADAIAKKDEKEARALLAAAKTLQQLFL